MTGKGGDFPNVVCLSGVQRRHIPNAIDVKGIREGLGLTQQEFAFRYRISPRTLQKWEQGVRTPEGPARTYLIVIKNAPEAVAQALQDTN